MDDEDPESIVLFDDPESILRLFDDDDCQDPLLDQDLGFSSRDSHYPPPPPPSSSSSSSTFSDTFLVGFVIGNIVGTQHYAGTINGREIVSLVREPLNPHDEYAIKVLNMGSMQVGHIEKRVAAVLSPWLDSKLITVIGIVPKPLWPGGNKFKIPCQIHIFTAELAISFVKSTITERGLQLITGSDVAFTLSESVAVREKSGKPEKSIDEIFKLVDENVGKKGALEPLEPPKEVIKSELFPHQKEGLGWLVHRENSGELPPFWEEKNGFYVNVLTNFSVEERPEPLRGGIFADDMGLGKTLTLLSLIAFDKYGSAVSSSFANGSGRGDVDNREEMFDFDNELAISISRMGKRGRASEKRSGFREKLNNENSQPERNVKRKLVSSSFANGSLVQSGTKTTLVVCPPSVFSTWVTQLGEHIRPGKLKMYMYYGERTNDPEELKKYDIVMTTYSTLAAEHFKKLDSPIKKIEWWRVILDEAHMIKSVSANQSCAVTSLKSKRRWVVTGTPIQNGSFDLFSLMVFLRFEPFSIKSYWQSLVQDPLIRGKEVGLSRLQVLMATISLRRAKEKGVIGLPPKTVEIFYVELSSEERELYDQMEAQAKSVVLDYINAGSLMYNYSTVLSIILRLRQICTDFALCPADVNSLLPSTNIEDVTNNPELLVKLVEVLQDGEDFDCPICMDPPTKVVITRCAHIFCQVCILKALQRTQPCCPLCRRPLSQSDLFSSPPKPSDTDSDREMASRSTISSKVAALLQHLVASRDQNPASKSVVFSQFRKMLILLEKTLKAYGFKTLRLDGSMNAKKRAQVIAEFEATGEGGPTVFLASLRASGTGINLTAASSVYLLEPWWNPAVEEQAMDRVHRIGQKEQVKIVRLIAKDSIECRILELQERKKQLAHDAFRRRGTKNRREISIDDLRTLMSL